MTASVAQHWLTDGQIRIDSKLFSVVAPSRTTEKHIRCESFLDAAEFNCFSLSISAAHATRDSQAASLEIRPSGDENAIKGIRCSYLIINWKPMVVVVVDRVPRDVYIYHRM